MNYKNRDPHLHGVKNLHPEAGQTIITIESKNLKKGSPDLRQIIAYGFPSEDGCAAIFFSIPTARDFQRMRFELGEGTHLYDENNAAYVIEKITYTNYPIHLVITARKL